MSKLFKRCNSSKCIHSQLNANSKILHSSIAAFLLFLNNEHMDTIENTI
jgi:hypothetical protein